jgi:hypothetical protein
MIDECPFNIPRPETVCTMEGLLYFVWEREAIRMARENGHKSPWTNDPVLGKYKFTNIHRIDDRVSKWFVTNLIDPYEGRDDLWFTLLIARLINWPPTLHALLDAYVIPCHPTEFDPELFVQVVESCKKTQEKVYSGAYMVYPTKMDPGGNKSQAIATHIIGAAIEKWEDIQYEITRTDRLTSIAEFVTVMSRCFGISTFMAGQVAADLTYASKGQLCDACDIFTWAPVGPGSSRGLNYLLERAPTAGWGQEQFNTELTKIHDAIYEELGICTLTLHDVQNIMCEYSKYCRTVLGDGKPKTTYTPETEF